MNENFMGMDPELAKVAMNKIKSKKNELDTESRNATSALRDKVNSAFAGSQTASMQGFIDRINAALERLYTYLDGAFISVTILSSYSICANEYISKGC